MSNEVNYVCNKCGYISIEKKKSFTFLRSILYAILVIFIVLTSFMGTLSLYNSFLSSRYGELGSYSTGGAYSFYLNNFGNLFIDSNTTNQLSLLANKKTSSCTDNECKIVSLYSYLSTFDYESGTNLFNPLTLIQEQRFDCDESAFLFKSLLATLNINSNIQCSSNHCWLVINTDGKKIIADIVQQYLYYDDSEQRSLINTRFEIDLKRSGGIN